MSRLRSLAIAAIISMASVAVFAQEMETPSGAMTDAGLTQLFDEARQASELQIANGDAGTAMMVARGLLTSTATQEDQSYGIDLLTIAANAGVVEAIERLADATRNGKFGLKVDLETAVALYQRGAEAGSNTSRRALAAMLMRGQGAELDAPRAISLLQDAIDTGDATALVQLAAAHRDGTGIKVDTARAIELYKIGVAAGNNGALRGLAALYRLGGDDLPANAELAFALYSEAADKGDEAAMRVVAEMLEAGEGVTADPAAATRILEEIAQTSDGSLFITLGEKALEGGASPADPMQALAYFAAAAEQGSVTGLLRQASLYATGADGLEANGARAVELYEQAVAQGSSPARRALSRLLREGGVVETDLARSVQLLTDGAEAGDAASALTLGILSADGKVFPANFEQASTYFNRAAELGERTAMVRFGAAVTNGPLATEHAEEGVAILRDAVAAGLPGSVLELARLQIGGRVPGEGPDVAIAALRQAIDNGDGGALRYLVGVYRNGVRGAVRANVSEAVALLEEHKSVLPPNVATMETIYNEAASGASVEVFDRIAAGFLTLDNDTAESVLARLRQANANAYVYIIQDNLKRSGTYAGELNGTLTRSTINAINAACEANVGPGACRRGPLSVDGSRAIAQFVRPVV